MTSIRANLRLLVPILTILGFALTSALPRYAQAQTSRTVFTGPTYHCTVASPCSSSQGQTGVDVDTVNNVVYFAGGDGRLTRVDGATDLPVDSITLANCGDARKPAVAHVSGAVKVYVGCEDSPAHVAVVNVGAGRFGTMTEGTPITLKINGQTFEPKTEKGNDQVGLVYVVGDYNGGALCSDPAFAIDTSTDTIAYTNSMMGDPQGVPGTSKCNTNQFGHTGINDLGIDPRFNTVFFFNEDVQRVYRTAFDLTMQTASMRVPWNCGTSAFPEDAPTNGDVLPGNVVLASSHESAAPCNNPEPGTGALFSVAGGPQAPKLTRYQVTPRYQISRVTAANPYFLIAELSDNHASNLPNCAFECVQVRDAYGTLLQSIPMDTDQNDIAYNPVTRKAYIAMIEGKPHDYAVIMRAPGS